MRKAECPKCSLRLEKDDSEFRVGREFFCPQCGAYFKIADMDPIRFAVTRSPVEPAPARPQA
jgi:acetone carboxylase gamma subunit